MDEYKLPFNSAEDIDFRVDEETKEQLNIINEILKIAQDNNKFIFLKGGWNIDLSFGRPTRMHDDVDFHYEKKDKEFWKKWFSQKGFTIDEKDDWYMVCEIDDTHIDFEAFEVCNDEIIWKHGDTSKVVDVVEDGEYAGVKFKKMKLNVERYLKEKRTNLREKDLHDLAVINLVQK